MSRSLRCRAQTEPFAAIVAVGLLVVGIGIYAVAMQGLLPGFSDRATAGETIDRVWLDMEEDGVYHAHGGGDDLDALVTGEALPGGASVYVGVAAVDGDEIRTIAEEAFPPEYPHRTTDQSDLRTHVADEGVPERASVATQSIPVALENEADVRAGTLRVSVW